MLKETGVDYLASNTVLTDLEQALIKWKPLLQVPKGVLHGCSAYFTVIERDGRDIPLTVNFSRSDTWSELSGLCPSKE